MSCTMEFAKRLMDFLFSFSSALFQGAAVKLFVCWLVLAPWRAARNAAGCGFLPLHPVASKVRIKGENHLYVCACVFLNYLVVQF